MSIKISIIGAGSAVFSLGLIRDICLTPNLAGSTICFMDIDEERLDTAYTLCRRYADEVGMQLTLEKTTDRRASMVRADFVINTALPGGHERMAAGWDIAAKHGYRFGGSLHIVHDESFWINFYQYRLMEDVLRDMLEVSPNAWYMLVANPVISGTTYLKRKYPQANIVGQCHGYAGVYKVAEVLGLDKKDITYEIPGVNHFVWLTRFGHKGKNAFPILDEWIKTKAEQYWETCGPCDAMGPKAVDLYRRFGVFPIGDTGNPGGGSWGYWYHTDDATEKRWKEDPRSWYYDGYFPKCAEKVAEMERVAHDESLRVTEHYPLEKSDEQMVPIIESIAFDIPRVLVVNVLNEGSYVPGIPADFEVEIPAYVSGGGIQGIRTGGLPRPLIQHALRDRVTMVELELEAYRTGSMRLLEDLVMMDPWTRSEEQAKGLIKEILDQPWNEAMLMHYR